MISDVAHGSVGLRNTFIDVIDNFDLRESTGAAKQSEAQKSSAQIS
jgi:hypothetical protein